jgi:hypothetical protein
VGSTRGFAGGSSVDSGGRCRPSDYGVSFSIEEALILVGLLGTLGGLVGVHYEQVMSYGRLQKLLSK